MTATLHDADFGRYRLCFELASGGMATVYLARVEGVGGFEKLVAVKVIHPHLANESSFVEMFLDEARIAALIHHPNVCQVFDFGQHQGVHYIAMEYLVGEPLGRVIRTLRTRDDPSDTEQIALYAARIVADACEGLHAAHELKGADGTVLGLVHRDISPQNLFLTYEGSAKVVDFGIAKAAQRIHHTETGKLKGKLAYVSPEQLRNHAIDRRSDVWAMGVCLWEMLTRKRLFRRDSDAATLMAVATNPVPSVTSVRPELPVELDTILQRALARDPEARYSTARHLSRDLRQFLTASGATVGMAEIEEWMDTLLRDRKERRLELVQLARTAEARTVVVAPAALSGVETHSASYSNVAIPVDVLTAPSRPPTPAPMARPTPTPAPAAQAVAARQQSGRPARPRPPPPPPRPRQRRGWVLALAAVVLVAAGAGITAWTLSQLSPAAPTVVASNRSGAALAPPGRATDPGAAPAGRSTAPALAGAPVVGAADGGSPSPPAPTVEAPTAEEPAVEEPAPAKATPNMRSRGMRGMRGDRGGMGRGMSGRRPTAHMRRTMAPAGPMGTVSIATRGGWATVMVGGRNLGKAPRSIRLPAGTHRIRLLPFGEGPAHVETVRVIPGAQAFIRLTIHREQ